MKKTGVSIPNLNCVPGVDVLDLVIPEGEKDAAVSSPTSASATHRVARFLLETTLRRGVLDTRVFCIRQEINDFTELLVV